MWLTGGQGAHDTDGRLAPTKLVHYLIKSDQVFVRTMDDSFQYPVYFECPSLDREQQRKLEKYFQVRRKSGGGPCSSLANTNDKVYSIAFMEREGELSDLKHLLVFELFMQVVSLLFVFVEFGVTTGTFNPSFTFTLSRLLT